MDFGRGCGKVNVVKGDSEGFSDSYSGGYGDEDLGTLPGVCMLEEGLDSAAGEYSVTGERVIFGTTFSETAELLWLDDDAAVSKVEENNLQVEIDGFGGEVQVFSFFGELQPVLPDVSAGVEVQYPSLAEGVFWYGSVQGYPEIGSECGGVGLSGGCFCAVLEKFRCCYHIFSILCL